jgi:hypothetical protein
MRMVGSAWPWQKVTLRVVIACVLVTMFFGIVTLFLNRDVPFGITHATSDNGSAKAKCVTVPMLDLLLIFSVGLVLGMLIMRILIRPLLTKNDKP